MSLKIIFIPLLVVCILVISIRYIKPGITLLTQKQNQLKLYDNQLRELEKVATNIKSMQTQIATSQSDSDSAMSDADFLRQIYFPTSSDIEKGIDQLNFLADRSGIAVGNIDVEDAKPSSKIDPVVEDIARDSAALLIAKPGGDIAIGEVPLSVHRTYTPDTFGVTIETAGSYEATKDFYARLVQAKRFFLLKTVQLSSESPDPADKKTDSNVLYSKVEIQFMFLPEITITTALGDDVFTKTKLDFDTLAMIRQNKQGIIPELPMTDLLGKTNLFIK